MVQMVRARIATRLLRHLHLFEKKYSSNLAVFNRSSDELFEWSRKRNDALVLYGRNTNMGSER